MIRPYARILQEVGDACDYARSNGEIQDVVANCTTSGNFLAHLSDTDIVQDYVPQLPDRHPAEVALRTADEVTMAINALNYIHGFPNRQSRIDQLLGHEGPHLVTAGAFFEDTEHRIQILSSRPSITYKIQPHTVYARPRSSLTKLAIASITAAPSDSSPGDLAFLTAMGYADREDVVQRLQATTDPRLTRLALLGFFKEA